MDWLKNSLLGRFWNWLTDKNTHWVKAAVAIVSAALALTASVTGIVLLVTAVAIPTISTDLMTALTLFYVVLPICLLILLLAFSFAASVTGVLTNNPNSKRPDGYDPTAVEGADPNYGPDDFGIFAKIENGQAMVRVLGKAFHSGFMLAPGLSFRGHHQPLPERDERYWDVIKTPTGAVDTHPVPHYNWLSWKTVVFATYRLMWWLWQRLTFNLFGLVFVGIWFVRLRIYPMEYFDEAKDANGKFTVKRRLNYSNHYRVYDFQFFIPIESVDTQDMIPVKMVLSEIMRVKNLVRVAFKSDNNWVARLFARIPSVVNEVVNTFPVNDVVASKSDGVKLTERLQPELMALTRSGRPLHSIGLGFANDALTIPDRSVKDPVDEKRLGEPARAEADRKAAELRAKGEAADIRETGKAMKEAGDMIEKAGAGALEIARIEGGVRQADAAGKAGGTVIVGNTAGVIASPQPKGD